MVELVEVEDESFETKQAGPSDYDDDEFTDTGSHLCSKTIARPVLIIYLPMMKIMFPKKNLSPNDSLPSAT
jgi:hypothetical protein